MNRAKAEKYFYQGVEYVKKGQFDLALECFNQAIQANLKYADAYSNRGSIYCDQLKQYERALSDFNQAIKLNPKYAMAYNNRGNVYNNLKQHEQALNDYNQSIRLNSKEASFYYNRGLTYCELKQYENALNDYSQAIKLNSIYADAYNNRGTIYCDQLKQYEQALSDFNRAIKLNLNNVNAYFNRGNVYYELKQYEQALNDFNQAIKLNSKYASAYNNRGLTYCELKQYENAKDDWDKCIELTQTKENKKLSASLCYSTLLAFQHFELAEYYAHKIFEFSENLEEVHKKIYLENIDKAKEIYQKNQELEKAYLLLKEDYKAEVEEKKRFEEMSIMATGVAHEINQPVGIIRATVSAAQTDLKENLFSVETELYPLLDTILSQTKRLEHIIDNFRAFSRGDHSNCEIVDLNKLVDQTISVLNSQLKSIQIIIEKNLHTKVWANFFALERVLINLLKNAKEALENRENPIIWIKINQQNQSVIIIIEDNGCGVDPNFESQLFTPFISTKSTSKGTGLGLNLSRRLIEEFNGQLTYQPTKEIGASFKITLPLFREENHHG
jgi:signal transduction histidine kinase